MILLLLLCQPLPAFVLPPFVHEWWGALVVKAEMPLVLFLSPFYINNTLCSIKYWTRKEFGRLEQRIGNAPSGELWNQLQGPACWGFQREPPVKLGWTGFGGKVKVKGEGKVRVKVCQMLCFPNHLIDLIRRTHLKREDTRSQQQLICTNLSFEFSKITLAKLYQSSNRRCCTLLSFSSLVNLKPPPPATEGLLHASPASEKWKQLLTGKQEMLNRKVKLITHSKL